MIGLLFAACLAAWLMFWNFGRIALSAHDWPKEAFYFDVIREAILHRQIPFYVDKAAQQSSWFLAVPEVPLSPQLLLLPLVSNGMFITINGILLWSIGFLGCLGVRRAYGMPLPAIVLIVIVFSFNGHIVAHLAVGHSMWIGYFLTPFVMLHILRLTDGDRSTRNALLLSLWLSAMLLQGSFHLVVYMSLFVAILCVLLSECRFLVLVGAFVALLAAVRVVPGLVAFQNSEQLFMNGYSSLSSLVDSLVAVRPIEFAPQGGLTLAQVGWWELDAYVSLTGLLFIVGFGVIAPLASGEPRTRALLWTCLAFVALSLGDVMYLLGQLGVPVINKERVPSRVIVAPLVCLLFLAARFHARFAVAYWHRRELRSVMNGCLVLTSGGLLVHLLKYRITNLETHPTYVWRLSPIAPQPSPFYEWLWLGAAAMSIIAWLAASVYLIRRCALPDRGSG